MAKASGQKLKLLYIVKILSEDSYELHPISTKELIEKLDAYGIKAERKSIYSDIAALIEFGYDIVQVDNRNGGGYYLASGKFELAELKLLVDAVQSSRFITLKKSRELIEKLKKLTNRYDAGKLQRQVHVAGRIKTDNESIYYHVDTLHRAIQEKRKISFYYLEWNYKKELIPKKSGKRYLVNPWSLIWQDEKYYLAAFESDTGKMRHYRVDKMADILIEKEKSIDLESDSTPDLADYTNKTFGMYGGREEMVTLSFPENLVGVVIDRFGRDITLRKEKERIKTRVKVAVSDPFYGWIAGIGDGIEIISPANVREEYISKLTEILKCYKKDE